MAPDSHALPWVGLGRRLAAIPLLALFAASLSAATITVQTNRLGPTPEILGYNSGHFFPGSNTREWWRYSGANGARFFVSASAIEPSDDLAPVGDGVTNQASFLARRAALRADPLNPVFINWPYLGNRYETTDLYPNNHIKVNDALRELRKLGVQILAQITVSQSRFPLTDTNDWAGKWELWQHCYAQAFHLGREFEVQRYQMFNEPNHSSAGGLTIPDFLQRLQLASDAFQSALADVNRLFGKSLQPLILAPVTSGTADGAYPGWGEAVVTNRHRNFLGQTDTNFWLVHRYDYHQYGTTPSGFGSDLASLRAQLAADMAPESPFLPAISEFNVHTGADFDTMPDTLDTPAKYSRFGAIAVNLAENGIHELYAFKFSQTERAGVYPVQKNAMHYVDNDTAPYAIGGITKAGEVFRLFARAAAPGRDRLGFTASGSAANLDSLAIWNRMTRRLHLYVVNNTSSSVSLKANSTAWNVPANNLALVEEVSEAAFGAGRLWTNVAFLQNTGDTQGSNSVWLFNIPTRPQSPAQSQPASDDAMVKDGVNRLSNYGTSAVLWVKNHSTNANARNAAFLKFRLPPFYPPDLEFAVLRLHASSINGASPVQAHVYGLTNTAWSQTNLTWATAPNLLQSVPPGADYTNNFIRGVGDSAQLLGQIVAGGAPADRTLDLTDFARPHAGREIAILLVREVRFPNDAQDSDGLSIVSLEGDANKSPRLDLVRLRDSDGDGLSDEAETSSFATSPALADTDRDGLSDGDEVLIHGTSPTIPDTDADGMKDGDEIIAATDPRDGTSFLRVHALRSSSGSGVRLEWSAVTNRLYRVFRAGALTNAPWLEILTVPGRNGLMTHTDPAGPLPASFFYRLQVGP